LHGEIEGFPERCQRFFLFVRPEQIGATQKDGDALNGIVKRAGDEELLFGGIDGVVARTERGGRFLLCGD